MKSIIPQSSSRILPTSICGKLFRLSSLALINACIFAAISANAVSVVSSATGNWSNNSTWSTGYTPGNNPAGGTADSVYIRADKTVTISSNVTPSAPGSVQNIIIGEGSTGSNSGTLLITTGGSLTTTGYLQIMRVGNLSDATGTVTMTGGSLIVGTTLSVGTSTVNNSGDGSGTFNISGASVLSITGATSIGSSTVALGSGSLNVSGHLATISGSSSLAVNSFGSINLAFDSTGISMLNFGAVSFASGSTLTIDGSLYSGSGGNITLINGSSLAGSFTNVNITGFAAGYGTPTLDYNSTSGDLILNLASIPEPSAAALLGAGAAVFAGVLTSRSKRRS